MFSGPIETQPFHLFVRQFEVNVFGHVRVTQALMPFVRRNASTLGGRVVNLVSIAGRVSTYLMGAYAGSKHSMEAVTDSLRREVRKFNISVSAIEPGMCSRPSKHCCSCGLPLAGYIQTPLLAGITSEALENNDTEVCICSSTPSTRA